MFRYNRAFDLRGYSSHGSRYSLDVRATLPSRNDGASMKSTGNEVRRPLKCDYSSFRMCCCHQVGDPMQPHIHYGIDSHFLLVTHLLDIFHVQRRKLDARGKLRKPGVTAFNSSFSQLPRHALSEWREVTWQVESLRRSSLFAPARISAAAWVFIAWPGL
jgi:hypothetical protein